MKKNTIRNLYKLSASDLILKETSNYLIANKPPHLSCLEDRVEKINLLSIFKNDFPDSQICHRIDKETSGIVVFSKNNDAYKHFSSLLEAREVKKIYYAIIHGAFNNLDEQYDDPIYVGQNKSRIDYKNGKPSLTLVKTLETFKNASLLKCFPVTGRMHQIRVHLAYHKMPLVNDSFYGGKGIYLSDFKKNYRYKEDQEEKSLISRIPLHAAEITFKELDGQIIDGKADYPKDFSTLLNILKKYN